MYLPNQMVVVYFVDSQTAVMTIPSTPPLLLMIPQWKHPKVWTAPHLGIYNPAYWEKASLFAHGKALQTTQATMDNAHTLVNASHYKPKHDRE